MFLKMYCIVLYCIVLYCIVLYCIDMNLVWEEQLVGGQAKGNQAS